MSEPSLPSREDFVVYGDLDAIAAWEHFGGKSLDEARSLLDDNFLYYQEDFVFMGPRAFAFYAEAFAAYMEDAVAAGAEDADHEASMFTNACAAQIELAQHHHDLRPCAQRLADCLHRIAAEVPMKPALAARVRRIEAGCRQLAASVKG